MIPVFEPTLGAKEKEYVLDCLEKNWISFNGEYNKKFEQSFAEFCDVKYGIATTNGTTALHLAMAALDIKEGDEVIVPDFTMALVLSVIFSSIFEGSIFQVSLFASTKTGFAPV